jgi:hypothetical protein
VIQIHFLTQEITIPIDAVFFACKRDEVAVTAPRVTERDVDVKAGGQGQPCDGLRKRNFASGTRSGSNPAETTTKTAQGIHA